MTVDLSVEPERALIDEPVVMTLRRLLPGQKVTLAAKLTERKMTFISHAHYEADPHGEVNVTKMASTWGTYTGVEPMGLFWSMVQAPGQRKGLRLVKQDVTTPYEINLFVYDSHIDPFINTDNVSVLSKKTVFRSYLKEGVRRVPVRAGRVRGALFLPPGEGRFPGVIDLYGTGGGLKDHRAALLASYGYLTLALAYFEYEDLPKTLDVDIDYFEEAIDWFSSYPSVIKDSIAIVSSSFGAELAMLTASVVHKVKGVVAISQNPYVTFCGHTYKDRYFDYLRWDTSFIEPDGDGNVMVNSSPLPRQPEARIRLEDFRCPLLILQGTDDVNVYPSAADDVRNMEREFGKLDVEVVTYEGAGHLLEPPFSPLCAMSYHSFMFTTVRWGGKPVPHARAQEDLWKRILKFLQQHLSHNNTAKL